MKTKTLMLKESSGQLMVTPQVYKCYSNEEYKVYKTFGDEPSYVVIRKSDDKCGIFTEYPMKAHGFDLEFISSF